jgi:hypothetical protein
VDYNKQINSLKTWTGRDEALRTLSKTYVKSLKAWIKEVGFLKAYTSSR